jgi:hypothetical protein
MMLAAAVGMAFAGLGSAVAAAPRLLSKTLAPSATMGSSLVRLSATGKRKGGTVAQQKRAAQKKRNQVRHKAACRG